MGFHKIEDPEERDRSYVRTLRAHVDESEIDRCVLLAYDQVFDGAGKPDPGRSYLYIPNDYVRDIAAQNPSEFLYGASVSPLREDAIDELDRVKADGAVLVKLLPNSQGFDPADADLLPYWRKAAEIGLPILIHCGFEHTIPAIDQQFGDPRRLVPALEEGVEIIVAHGGTSGRFHFHETFGDTLALLARYPNLWADNSAMANVWRSRYLFELLQPNKLESRYGVAIERPFDRVLHGSDFPVPITPWAFVGKIERKQLKAARRLKNPIQQDVDLKRAAGVPDDCLVRGAVVLGVGSSGEKISR